VATEVNQQTNDQQQLRPMLELVETHMGRKPDWVSADTGYWSEPNVTDPAVTGIDLYIAVELVKHGKVIETVSGPPPPERRGSQGSNAAQTRHRARQRHLDMSYAILEPVFRQSKERRNCPRFSLRVRPRQCMRCVEADVRNQQSA
jgi:hypothetical protein